MQYFQVPVTLLWRFDSVSREVPPPPLSAVCLAAELRGDDICGALVTVHDCIKLISLRDGQAIRRRVNHEADRLEALMTQIPSLLEPNGRAGLLSFHPLDSAIITGAFTAPVQTSLALRSRCAALLMCVV